MTKSGNNRFNRPLQAGEKVRVRQWDDMVEEFGQRPNGNIPCMNTFVPEMRQYCGQETTLLRPVTEFPSTVYLDKVAWNWSTDMIELVDDINDNEW